MAYTPSDRRRIINEIKQMFVQLALKDETATRERTIAHISSRYGSSRRTSIEYLSTLVGDGTLTEQEGFIWLTKETEARADALKEADELLQSKIDIDTTQ